MARIRNALGPERLRIPGKPNINVRYGRSKPVSNPARNALQQKYEEQAASIINTACTRKGTRF